MTILIQQFWSNPIFAGLVVIFGSIFVAAVIEGWIKAIRG